MKKKLINIISILFSVLLIFLALPKESEKTVIVKKHPFEGKITIHKNTQWFITTYKTSASLTNVSSQAVHYELYGVDKYRPYEVKNSIFFYPEDVRGIRKDGYHVTGGMIYEYVLEPNDVLTHQDRFKTIQTMIIKTKLEYNLTYYDKEMFSYPKRKSYEFHLTLE